MDPRTFDKEIGPAVDTMIEKWGEAHAHFQRLTHPHDSSPPALSKAGWELVDAMREVTTTRRNPASAEDMIERVDAPSLVRALHRFHATIAGVATLFHETSRSTPLLVDARAANDLARSAPEDGLGAPRMQGATVAPRDVLHKRAIPQPPEVGGRSDRAGMQAARASREAMRSTLAVGDGQRDAMTVPKSWAHAVTPEARLAASQRLEQRDKPWRPANATPLHSNQ